jgi:hypothetical protein
MKEYVTKELREALRSSTRIMPLRHYYHCLKRTFARGPYARGRTPHTHTHTQQTPIVRRQGGGDAGGQQRQPSRRQERQREEHPGCAILPTKPNQPTRASNQASILSFFLSFSGVACICVGRCRALISVSGPSFSFLFFSLPSPRRAVEALRAAGAAAHLPGGRIALRLPLHPGGCPAPPHCSPPDLPLAPSGRLGSYPARCGG